ncbi:MAG: hypothetical protein IKY98_05280 [Alphaproteobacteria bacterium]|nr:hypothetical protein [Alphaproteobacteria bacterium]
MTHQITHHDKQETGVINQIFVANSAYSLFTYLLMFPERVDETLFVAGPAIKDIDVPHKVIFNILPKEARTTKEEEEFSFRGACRVHGRVKISFLAQLIWRKACRHVFNKNGFAAYKQIPCYGNANEDNNPFIDIFMNKHPFYALSDGLSDYDLFPKYYQDDRILKCYSTADIIKDLNHDKLIKFDIQALWNELSEEHKNKIADIFNMSAKDLSTAASRSIVLITQPLSEDKMMSESDKVALYSRIVNNYGVDNVVMKPHPREKTNWAKIFPDMPIIPRQIPVELLTKLVRLNRVATFFSTAAFGSVSDDKIDFYSKDFADLKSYHPHLVRVCEQTGEERKSIAVSDIEEIYGATKKCHWRRIPDIDNRFYRPALKVDEAGIPTYMAPSVVRKILSVRQNILPDNVREE